jgi:carbonic anhydrase/acetyltransferase-like protein (isoleucine patch superfamily)
MLQLINRLTSIGHRAHFALWVRYVRGVGRWNGVDVRIVAQSFTRGVPRLTFASTGRGGTASIEIGDDVNFARGSRMDVQTGAVSKIVIGSGSTFHEASRVHLYGATVTIGRDFIFRPGALIHAYGRLMIGEGVTISFGAIVHCGTSVSLGDRSGLGERVSLVDSEHTADGSDVDAYRDAPTVHAPIVVGPNTLVLTNSVILRGVTLGKNSIVGASSVVLAGDYPDSSLIVGSPAVVKRDLSEARPVGSVTAI